MARLQPNKKTPDTLIERGEWFQRLFDTNPSAIFVWEIRGESLVLVEVNEAAQEMMNGRAKDFLGMSAADIYADLPEVLENLCESVRTTRMREFELHFRRRSGEGYGWANCRAAFMPPDSVILYADLISDQKRVEEELIRSERRRQQAQKLAQVGHRDWYMETGELKWSEEVYEIFGRDPDIFSVTAESFEACIHPDDLD